MSDFGNNQTPKRQKLELLPLIISILILVLYAVIFLLNSIVPQNTDLVLIGLITILFLIEGARKKKENFVAGAILGGIALIIAFFARYYL